MSRAAPCHACIWTCCCSRRSALGLSAEGGREAVSNDISDAHASQYIVVTFFYTSQTDPRGGTAGAGPGGAAQGGSKLGTDLGAARAFQEDGEGVGGGEGRWKVPSAPACILAPPFLATLLRTWPDITLPLAPLAPTLTKEKVALAFAHRFSHHTAEAVRELRALLAACSGPGALQAGAASSLAFQVSVLACACMCCCELGVLGWGPLPLVVNNRQQWCSRACTMSSEEPSSNHVHDHPWPPIVTHGRACTPLPLARGCQGSGRVAGQPSAGMQRLQLTPCAPTSIPARAAHHRWQWRLQRRCWEARSRRSFPSQSPAQALWRCCR